MKVQVYRREGGKRYVNIYPYGTLVGLICHYSANCKAGFQHAREAINGAGVILGGNGCYATP